MTEPDWTATIRLTDHALIRLRERCKTTATRRTIRGEIRAAILEGRWSRCEPGWTAGPTAKDGQERDVFYVWDAPETRVWVMKPERRTGTLHVLTVLSRASEDSDQHRLRPGMRRVA